MATKRARQQPLSNGNQHGGRRRGAGRKPLGERAGVSHRHGAALPFPVHVSVVLRSGLPRLRRRGPYTALRAAFATGRERPGFRLVHYAVLDDHLHFIVEAAGRAALRAGVQGLLVRIARRLNRIWGRQGRVFADRYEDRILTTPGQVHTVLWFVMGKTRHRGAEDQAIAWQETLDMMNQAPCLDGFGAALGGRDLEATAHPVVAPRTSLLRRVWRRHGLLGSDDEPDGSVPNQDALLPTRR